ncbi:pilus assembly protein PilP [Calditerrivibrio nitroreducens]|uniref:Pilus assembly protein PilP n=1 Tax=Calditerrivibrio nitroreducens (strain DSM 19672 / NBRC 101217 / Yu37-1) TaxID=768670 RepID=E4TEL2_CALNY|nr:pilus assembly protein PilP [Calditerrivibrio nitroreducens]ADR19369.1 hypothetical protein Calni_1461 [Calditerrivibrio nitroreducens DSM 19672]
MKRIFLLLTALTLIACGGEDKAVSDIKKPVVRKEAPAKVDLQKLIEQEEELKSLFRQKVEPLKYKPNKDPFRSVVEVYKENLANQFNENPLKNATLDQVKLVGVLSSKLGNVGVVEISGQTFYVKIGDKIGLNDGIIVDIGDKYMRIRQMEKDIFGNVRSVIKEVLISDGGKL